MFHFSLSYILLVSQVALSLCESCCLAGFILVPPLDAGVTPQRVGRSQSSCFPTKILPFPLWSRELGPGAGEGLVLSSLWSEGRIWEVRVIPTLLLSVWACVWWCRASFIKNLISALARPAWLALWTWVELNKHLFLLPEFWTGLHWWKLGRNSKGASIHKCIFEISVCSRMGL